MKSQTHTARFGRKTRGGNITSAIIAGLFLLLLPAAWAQFTWPVYEPFGEYTEGELLGAGDSLANWNVGNGGSNGVSSYIITSAAAMSYPALVADTNSDPKGVMSVYVNTTSADRGFMFTPHTGTIYASFLLNYLDNGVDVTGYAQNRCMFNIVTGATSWTNGSYGAIYSSVWLTPDYQIVIDKNYQQGGTLSGPSPVLATNVPHLIVVRYEVTGGNDEMDLWVDPMPFGNDGSVPPPTLTTTNGPNIANFNALMLNSRKTPQYTATAFYEDEIRLGDSWSSVTPLATPPPGPSFTVIGGGTSCPDSPPDVALDGSVATNVYFLYTNNTYSGVSQIGTGAALDFGTETTPAVYSVLASNTITAAIGWMSNSVTVAVTQPPTIVSEPVAVVTATNNRAEFRVGVTGDSLSYQWYQNGVALTDTTNIVGSTTDDLLISPATTANIGDYYCVITNTCLASAISTTNSLTLDAPDNLTWAGDAFGINEWAVGATTVPEFTDPNNNQVFFNEGDNVTFNDTYDGGQYGSTITLSNILTPTLVTYATSQGLTWGGSGYIDGSGSLLVTGSGVLKLANNSAGGHANTFSGGTVISNGMVNMPYSWTGLGTGPVTLAGGALETDQKGNGTSTGLAANLLVTAKSTWQVDKTGNQCAGLLGALLGSAGTTLTISNSATTTKSANEIRFGGEFTNDSAIVTAINILATNSSMQIGSFNPSGAQIYNGAISGDTAAFTVSGAGAVYLNGANTYTNATQVTAGFLGGSGSIDGPLTVSSGGTVGGGPIDAIGTFTVNGNVNLNGKVSIRLDKSLAQSNDIISVTGVITNGGTGTVTLDNIGAAPLIPGDRFQIFNQPVENGAALTVTGSGMAWINNLAVDGSVQVSPVITAAPVITGFSLTTTNANLVITGTNGQTAIAYLLMATNIVEPMTQWKTVATGMLSDSFIFIGTNAITPGSPQQFFRLSSTNYNP